MTTARSIRIHHATRARAAKLGIELIATDELVTASHDGVTLNSGTDPKFVLARAEELLEQVAAEAKAPSPAPAAEINGKTPRRSRPALVLSVEPEVDDEADAAEVSKAEGKSVITAEYRQRYKATGGTCGDDLSDELAAYLNGAEGAERLKKLRKLAEANGCWVEAYAGLNNGQQRMTIGNRLRARIRKGHTVVWG